ncbi:centrosomal protein of 41 kDa isoform X2 [Corythoichthys intestinalis]|uniref:centrosomal protein of 41 kDa isoform X2 n=1 Tax=Corythoichthys intestinalis TaxID=161448 RepID=UPI0025A54C03|nr:centrosomal protein of 41 kDa isoform X2 [Corythoichthys intestinalis]
MASVGKIDTENKQYMRKRIPKNAKYQHIKTKLDTGVSFTKYMERLEEIKQHYKFNKGEIFKRFKVTTFAELVLQVASVSDLNECVSGDSCHNLHEGGSGDNNMIVAKAEPEAAHTNGARETKDMAQDQQHSQTMRSTLLSVINGVGELNVNGDQAKAADTHVGTDTEKLYKDCPYLLLDVRERELYDQCHIITAHSFPITMLSRTMNPYTKEVLEYKNAEGKIIIVYDEDERIATQVATSMCQRGFENLFMLSGGLKVIAQKFPEGMTTGPLPASCLPPTVPSKWRKCVPPPPPLEQMAGQRWRFTADELARIEGQLENISMTGSSRTSSRMSTCSSVSKVSSIRSRQASSASSRDSGRVQRPWK